MIDKTHSADAEEHALDIARLRVQKAEYDKMTDEEKAALPGMTWRRLITTIGRMAWRELGRLNI